MADTNNIQCVSIAQLTDAQLPGSDVNNIKRSLIEIEKCIDTNTYSSTKTELSAFAKALLSGAGLDTEIKARWGLKDGVSLSDYTDYYKTLSTYIRESGSRLSTSANKFYVDSSPVASQNHVSEQLSTNNRLSLKGNQGGYYSTFNSLENNSAVLVVSQLSAGGPSVEGEEHNRYIFKISQHTSNTYVAERAGWFTCYGWVSEKETYTPRRTGDEGQGRQDNSKRWVALEGYFKESFPDDTPEEDCWRIIQLQPFQPNNYCSYVSFSLPVASGLSMRITSGFDVNNNSGKYSMVAGSLTNHVPNAFVGGVYYYDN